MSTMAALFTRRVCLLNPEVTGPRLESEKPNYKEERQGPAATKRAGSLPSSHEVANLAASLAPTNTCAPNKYIMIKTNGHLHTILREI